MTSPIAGVLSSDIRDAWRDLTPSETTRADTLIEYASAIIRDEIPGIDARIDAGVSADTVKAVVVAMVVRVLAVPTAVRQRSRAVDDYTETDTFDATSLAGDLYLTDRERARLMGSAARDAVSMRLALPRW